MLTSIAEVQPVLASFMDAKITKKSGINKKHDARIWVMYQISASCDFDIIMSISAADPNIL